MIAFHTETDFNLVHKNQISDWVSTSILAMKKNIGEINYIFCDDAYLLKMNQEYLNHDTLTDIISFDYSHEKTLAGDIFISVERVQENAKEFGITFEKELQRVLIHGILHFLGYKDKTDNEKTEMRRQEDYYLSLYKL